MPEEEWERGFLASPLTALVDALIFESSLSLADEETSEHCDCFRTSARVDIGNDFKGMPINVEVISAPGVAFFDIDPPHLGVGLLHFHTPRESPHKMDAFLSAEVYIEAAIYEKHRRIAVESWTNPRVQLMVSMDVVGLNREWNRSAPLVITQFSVLSKSDDWP
jgi:hypothetical protein